MIRNVREICIAAALAIGAAGAVTTAPARAQIPGPPPAPQSGNGLTCTSIGRECRRECPKEAPAEFCLGYCQQKRADCIATGKWDGIRRVFIGVEQR